MTARSAPPTTAGATDCPPGPGEPDGGAGGDLAGAEIPLGELTVNDVLAAAGLPDVTDTPIAELLGELAAGAVSTLPAGLPALPEPPPLPGLPALPALDPLALLAPVVELLGGFGTGQLTGGADITRIFTGLAQVLDGAVSSGGQALAAVEPLWSGAASAGAATKTLAAQADSATLAAQGGAIAADVQAAAGIVAAGAATVTGILCKTAGQIAATLPLITTPVGQGLALGFAAEGLAEALAAVAATRAELLAPTAAITAHGAPVPVTDPPIPVDGADPAAVFDAVTELLTALGPVVTAGASLAAEIAAPLAGAVATTDLSSGMAVAGPVSGCPPMVLPTGLAGMGSGGGGSASSAFTAPASLGAGGLAAGSGGLPGTAGMVPAAPLQGAPLTGVPPVVDRIGGAVPTAGGGATVSATPMAPMVPPAAGIRGNGGCHNPVTAAAVTAADPAETDGPSEADAQPGATTSTGRPPAIDLALRLDAPELTCESVGR